VAPTPPTGEPTRLHIGTSWQWDKSVSVTPPSEGYTLSYAFTGGGTVTDIAAATSSSGDFYEVRVPFATTQALEAGQYYVQGVVTKGAEKHLVYEGDVTLVSDYALDEPTPTQDEVELAAVNARITDRLTADVASFHLNGRGTEHIEIAELRKIQGQLRYKIYRSRNPGSIGRRVEVAF